MYYLNQRASNYGQIISAIEKLNKNKTYVNNFFQFDLLLNQVHIFKQPNFKNLWLRYRIVLTYDNFRSK